MAAHHRADAHGGGGGGGTPGLEEDHDADDGFRPDPVFARWSSTAKGMRVGVPAEWLEAPVGETLARSDGGVTGSRGGSGRGGRVLVEEVA